MCKVSQKCLQLAGAGAQENQPCRQGFLACVSAHGGPNCRAFPAKWFEQRYPDYCIRCQMALKRS